MIALRCALIGAFCVCAAAACSNQPSPARTAERTTSFTLYFVALNPAHPPGEPIGCGDVLVSERRTVSSAAPAESPLEAAVRAQLTATPPAGTINRLADLHVTLQSVNVAGRRATIVLAPFPLGGECDNPRVEAQLTRVTGQFHQFDRVEILVGSKTMTQYLSLR